ETSSSVHLRSRLLRGLLCHLSLRHGLCRKPRGSKIDRFACNDRVHAGIGNRHSAARNLRSSAQRYGASVVQALVDANRAGSSRAQHVRTLREPGVDRAIRLLAATRRRRVGIKTSCSCDPGLYRLRPWLRHGSSGYVPDQPFRPVRIAPSHTLLAGHALYEAQFPDTVLLPVCASSALPGIHAWILGYTEDDRRSPAL